jgi:hypothetical protein
MLEIFLQWIPDDTSMWFNFGPFFGASQYPEGQNQRERERERESM